MLQRKHVETVEKKLNVGMVKFVVVIELIRVKQWIKNGFVLAPLLFTSSFVHIHSIKQSVIAFGLFCLASSAIYIINDLRDIEEDRRHPRKRKTRPLAADKISKNNALLILACILMFLNLGWFFVPRLSEVIALFFILNLSYVFVFKYHPIWDIFVIACSFVMRIYGGTTALNAPLSTWMFVTTLCLALFLAAIKRRQEVLQVGKSGRRVLTYYNEGLLNRYAETASIGTVVFYGLYVTIEQPELAVTIPLVIFGVFRYWFIAENLTTGDSPTDLLLEDPQMLLIMILWVLICGWVLWPTAF